VANAASTSPVDQLVSLLQILDCDVRLVVRPKTA
jgi:hypothetical protein